MSEPIRRVARVRVFARLRSDPTRRVLVLSEAPLGRRSQVERQMSRFLRNMRSGGLPDAVALLAWYVSPSPGRTELQFGCAYASDDARVPVPTLPGLARDYLAREIAAWQAAGYAHDWTPPEPEDDAS